MRRIRLFEFEDLGWFPRSIRNAGTDLLRSMWEAGKVYRSIVPLLKDALLKTGSQHIVDMGSGGGGPAVAIYEELVKSGFRIRMTLTDKFPNLDAFKYAKERTSGGIDFVEEPVDATAFPAHLSGFRTMYFALHHFQPELVRRVLLDAVQKRSPIGIFDAAAFPSPPPPSTALLANPLGVLLMTPFIQPFRWSRFFWTYLIPVVPFFLGWDALVSGLRLYSIKQLREIAESLPANDYVWDIGTQRFPRCITYLMGYPRST